MPPLLLAWQPQHTAQAQQAAQQVTQNTIPQHDTVRHAAAQAAHSAAMTSAATVWHSSSGMLPREALAPDQQFRLKDGTTFSSSTERSTTARAGPSTRVCTRMKMWVALHGSMVAAGGVQACRHAYVRVGAGHAVVHAVVHAVTPLVLKP